MAECLKKLKKIKLIDISQQSPPFLVLVSLALPGKRTAPEALPRFGLRAERSTCSIGRRSLQFGGFQGRALESVGGVQRGVSRNPLVRIFDSGSKPRLGVNPISIGGSPGNILDFCDLC